MIKPLKLFSWQLCALLIFLWVPLVYSMEQKSWKELNSNVVSLYKSGQFVQAVPIAEEAIRIAEDNYSKDHPYVAVSLNNLAAIYFSQGDYVQAEALYKRALAIDEAVLGKDDPSTAIDRENLQRLNQAQHRSVSDQTSESAPAPSQAPSLYEKELSEESNRWIKRNHFGDMHQGEEKSRWWNADLSLDTGYRQDDLDWNIAGTSAGTNPNVLSELTWKELRIYQIKGTGRVTAEGIAVLRGYFDYGFILAGKNQDSDYLGNNRTLEFSRSNNDSDSGEVLDASIGLGYPFKASTFLYELTFTPLGGYSYHQQNLTISNGFQTIPATGHFNNLNSTYEPRWKGPWFGMDMGFKSKKWIFFGTFEYHWADYRADANWNLRTDFSHPKSYRHTADGYGVVGALKLSYLLTRNWSLYTNLDIEHWSTDTGLDRTFFSNGTTADTQLNEVNWDTYSISVGAQYCF